MLFQQIHALTFFPVSIGKSYSIHLDITSLCNFLDLDLVCLCLFLRQGLSISSMSCRRLDQFFIVTFIFITIMQFH